MRIKKGFTLRSVMGQHVILAEGINSDKYNKIIKLNDSAAMLWEELKGKAFDVSDAAALLVDRYGIDNAQADADAAYIINRMSESGLIEQ